MNRTTIMIPQELKIRANNLARKRGISLGELIRETLEKLCANNIKKTRDPFFADEGIYTDKTPRDLSEKHDDYLYKEEKW
jgi:predicted DNA-binding protein